MGNPLGQGGTRHRRPPSQPEQSIAVAVAATQMSREDESRLFRFTIRHSILLMAVMFR